MITQVLLHKSGFQSGKPHSEEYQVYRIILVERNGNRHVVHSSLSLNMARAVQRNLEEAFSLTPTQVKKEKAERIKPQVIVQAQEIPFDKAPTSLGPDWQHLAFLAKKSIASAEQFLESLGRMTEIKERQLG